MVLVKEPVPDPSVVLKLDVVGFGLVLQHIPRCVTAEPPLEITLPPHDALEEATLLGLTVVTVGVVPLKFVVVKYFSSL
jgi:hypothetical protein